MVSFWHNPRPKQNTLRNFRQLGSSSIKNITSWDSPMQAELTIGVPRFWKYLTLVLLAGWSLRSWSPNFNLGNFWTGDSRSFHSRTQHVVRANSPGRNFGQGRLITHLLCCRGTIIHEHNCGDNIDQQSNYGQSVWCDPCWRLLNKPVPEDLTRRLEQGSARGAVFVLLQPLELSGWQRLRPQEMWHVFVLFSAKSLLRSRRQIFQ